MIGTAKKKIREATFFLRQLSKEAKTFTRNEPEVFQFYLSAFLSAARSVTFAMQYEEKQKYDAWFPQWFSERTEDERNLMDFLKVQRNLEQKRGSTETSVSWEYIPVTDFRIHEGKDLRFKCSWFGPPGTPIPHVGRPIHSFDLNCDVAEVTAVCNRYIDILNKLVQDFLETHNDDIEV